MVVANATGCSSIFGGNLPTTPWTCNADGLGPGLGELAVRGQRRVRLRHAPDDRPAGRAGARARARTRAASIGDGLAEAILDADQHDEPGIHEQRRRVAAAEGRSSPAHDGRGAELLEIADYLVKKSVWIVGGDGWAYDIGYGGLDHVLASDKDVNVLVLDTEVYSNTGGQASKSTPRGAVARFAAGGKRTRQEGPRRCWR